MRATRALDQIGPGFRTPRAPLHTWLLPRPLPAPGFSLAPFPHLQNRLLTPTSQSPQGGWGLREARLQSAWWRREVWRRRAGECAAPSLLQLHLLRGGGGAGAPPPVEPPPPAPPRFPQVPAKPPPSSKRSGLGSRGEPGGRAESGQREGRGRCGHWGCGGRGRGVRQRSAPAAQTGCPTQPPPHSLPCCSLGGG